MEPVLLEDSLLLTLPFGGAVLQGLGVSEPEIEGIMEDVRQNYMESNPDAASAFEGFSFVRALRKQTSRPLDGQEAKPVGGGLQGAGTGAGTCAGVGVDAGADVDPSPQPLTLTLNAMEAAEIARGLEVSASAVQGMEGAPLNTDAVLASLKVKVAKGTGVAAAVKEAAAAAAAPAPAPAPAPAVEAAPRAASSSSVKGAVPDSMLSDGTPSLSSAVARTQAQAESIGDDGDSGGAAMAGSGACVGLTDLDIRDLVALNELDSSDSHDILGPDVHSAQPSAQPSAPRLDELMGAGAALPKPIGAPPLMTSREPGLEPDSDADGGEVQPEVERKLRSQETQEVVRGSPGLSDEGQGPHTDSDGTVE